MDYFLAVISLESFMNYIEITTSQIPGLVILHIISFNEIFHSDLMCFMVLCTFYKLPMLVILNLTSLDLIFVISF
jgi:hypothetical protein